MNQAASARRLRELLAGGFVQLPACFNPLTALMAQHIGFDALYVSGGATAMMAGMPDVGLMTQTEMLDNLRRITAAVDIPVVVDADTGYGNAINTRRTVREFERAGAAGMHLEDQEFPKKCGYLSGKSVVPATEHATKIQAACEARTNTDTVIIARTDALQTGGWDDVEARVHLYRDAGADLVFVDGVRASDMDEYVRRVVKAGVPALYNGLDVDTNQAAELGFAAAIQAVAIYAGFRAEYESLLWLREHGTPYRFPSDLAVPSITDLVGLPEITELELRYGGDRPSGADDREWSAGFDALEEFAAREHHTVVPPGHREGDFPLGSWIEDARRIANELGGRQAIMTPERRARFEKYPDWFWTSATR